MIASRMNSRPIDKTFIASTRGTTYDVSGHSAGNR